MAIRPESEEEESEEEDGESVMKTAGVGERIRAERDEEKVKQMNDPRKPTVQEVDDHNRTHLPHIETGAHTACRRRARIWITGSALKGKGDWPNSVLITAFLGTRSDIS